MSKTKILRKNILILLNWIKHRLIKITAFLLVLSFLLPLLIVGDWYLERVIKASSLLNNLEAKLLEKKRIDEEDIKYIREAVEDGYSQFIPPADYDVVRELSSQMKNKKIGIIGALTNKKIYYCNEGFGLVKYKSDRFGLRNDDKKWDSNIDAIFIGDSFTHGACVEDNQTISSVYEQLNRKNSINLGSGGNGSLHYKALAHLFIPKVNPRSVYLIFYINDMGKDHSTSHNINLDKDNVFFSDEVSLNKPNEYNEITTYAYNLSELKENYGRDSYKDLVFRIINSISIRASLPTIRSLLFNKVAGASLGDAGDAINYAHKMCEEYNCELNIVWIPSSDFWRPNLHKEQFSNLLNEETKKLNVNFFDATKVIDTSKESDDYGLGGHLSPKGYRKVAELISH